MPSPTASKPSAKAKSPERATAKSKAAATAATANGANGASGSNGAASALPLHRAIYEELLSEIHAGLYKPGDRLPSEARLCERFQASRITVAKAIQTLQREHLVRRRAGSGTFVESPAATPSLQFGLLIPDLGTTEIFEPICQGLMRSPAARSHSLTWGHSVAPAGPVADPVAATEQLCRQYIAQQVAGVFFAPTENADHSLETNQHIASLLERAGIHVVLLDRDFLRYPERSGFDLVGIDNHRAGYVLTQHLLESGARRILFAARPNSAVTVEARMAGYREALLAHGLVPPGPAVCGDFEDPAFVQEFLDRDRPDAVLCANDLTAARLMRTLVSLGVRIPADVRMAGVDDVSYARFLPTPLTTLRQDCAQIGAVAMQTMLERLRSPEQPVRDILLRCELVVRESSAAPPPSDA